MDLQATSNWTDFNSYQAYFAPTNDPRVVAVIQQDDDASFERNLDGDAILPVYLIERDSADHVGGFDDDESLATRIVEARDRFRFAAGYRYNGLSSGMIVKAEEMTARWAWIFHGTAFHRGSYGYQSDYDVLVMNTPAFREHVGVTEPVAREAAQSWCDSMKSEVQAIADNEVYGIGYAVNASRVLDDEDIEIEDGNWDIQIQVWGYIGEKYAQESAEAFEAGTPKLEALLDLA